MNRVVDVVVDRLACVFMYLLLFFVQARRLSAYALKEKRGGKLECQPEKPRGGTNVSPLGYMGTVSNVIARRGAPPHNRTGWATRRPNTEGGLRRGPT